MNSTKRISEISALYSDLDWQYNCAMSGPYVDYRDKTEDGETVAGLKDDRISGAWRPMVCVGTDKWQKSEIQRLWDISDDIYYMDFLIDGKLSEISRFLLKKGYRARPVYTQIIDLTKTEEQLHADLRKSYKSLVNQRNDLVIGDVKSYRILHEEIKGKKRNEETWNIQTKMKEVGQAFVIHDGWPYVKAQAIFYDRAIRKCNQITNEQWVESLGSSYYASATSRPNANSHAVIWEGIKQLKARGCKTLELGEQYYFIGMTPDYPLDLQGKPVTCKQVNISHFKAGFGGYAKTRLILEKGGN